MKTSPVPEGKKKTSITVDEDLWLRLGSSLKRRGLDYGSTIDEFIRDYLEKSESSVGLDDERNSTVLDSQILATRNKLRHKQTAKARRAHYLLDLVLESEIKQVRAAILSNLEAFAVLVGAITGEFTQGESAGDAEPQQSVTAIIEGIDRFIDSREEGERGVG